MAGQSHKSIPSELNSLSSRALETFSDRFEAYKRYPSLLYTLSEAHNPREWVADVANFIRTSEKDAKSKFDKGYTWPLYQTAWSHGSEAAAVTHMMSKPVQDPHHVFKIL